MTQLEGEGGVGALVLPCKAQVQRSTVRLVVLELWTHPQWASDLFGPLLEHGHGALWLSDGEAGDSGLEDASFLPGDLLDGVSKNLSVIYAERGDATHPRPPYDVGAVVRAAYTNFNHS